MTQQQLLQISRNILTGHVDYNRTDLKTAAKALGRSEEQVRKASTMRLALWVTKLTSAI
jgi:hypothetical protein